MNTTKNQPINPVLYAIVVLCIAILAVVVYNIYHNYKSQQADQINQPNAKEQLSNPDVELSIPSPILKVSAGLNSVAPSGKPITIICKGTDSYSCNIQIKSDTSSQVIEFPSQAIIDNGDGQAQTSWVWQAQSGKWTMSGYLSNAVGGQGLSPTVGLQVQ